jgi:O-antigen/teichoic acid export membrane protein
VNAAPTPGASLTGQTISGLKWSYLSTVVVFVMQTGVIAILARLLTPSEFGVVAMALVLLRFAQYFAQMGAGQAVVQKPELSERDVHAAFTSAALIGLVFCLLIVALAPLATVLFPDTPGVVAVIRVMSLTLVVGGLTATTQGLLRRRFAFRAIALAEIGSYLIGYALVGVVLAFSGFGAWSLVAASLGQGALLVAAYTLYCRRDIGLSLDRGSLKAIYSFGGRVSLIGFAEFLGTNLDTLWSGHYLGSRATGLYTRATSLATVPLLLLVTSLSRVLLPGYSRIQFERERLRSLYLATLTVVAAIIIPIAWGVAGAAHEVIATLLGPQWTAAVPVLAVLSLAAPFTLLTHFGAMLCEATATLNVKIVISLARIAWLALFLLLLDGYGIVGIATAFAISEFLTNLVYLPVMRRLLTVGIGTILRSQTIGLVAGAITGVTLYGLHAGLTRVGLSAPVILAVQVVVGGLFLLVTVVRPRGGLVWREIRLRLDAAGYGAQNTGAAARLFRMLDALASHRG